MAQRQDRDTFGVHQNRAVQNNSKRNSFSANWDVQSNITQETQDDPAIWAKETVDISKIDGRMSRSSSWGQAESTVTSVEPIRKTHPLSNERWDVEVHKNYEKSKSQMIKETNDRPTFRTHQFNKSAQEREKKLSVSTQNTEKLDKMEGKMIYCLLCINNINSWKAENKMRAYLLLTINYIRIYSLH